MWSQICGKMASFVHKMTLKKKCIFFQSRFMDKYSHFSKAHFFFKVVLWTNKAIFLQIRDHIFKTDSLLFAICYSRCFPVIPPDSQLPSRTPSFNFSFSSPPWHALEVSVFPWHFLSLSVIRRIRKLQAGFMETKSIVSANYQIIRKYTRIYTVPREFQPCQENFNRVRKISTVPGELPPHQINHRVRIIFTVPGE